MSNAQIKKELERKIIQREWEVDSLLDDLSLLHSESLDQLLTAWHELVRYYEANGDDAEIGVETLRSYVSFTRLLRKIMLNPETDVDSREKADEILSSFEVALENIIREVVSNSDTSRYQPKS